MIDSPSFDAALRMIIEVLSLKGHVMPPFSVTIGVASRIFAMFDLLRSCPEQFVLFL